MDDLQPYRDSLISHNGNPQALAEQYISKRDLSDVDIPNFCMKIKNALLYERMDMNQQRFYRELIRQLGNVKNDK